MDAANRGAIAAAVRYKSIIFLPLILVHLVSLKVADLDFAATPDIYEDFVQKLVLWIAAIIVDFNLNRDDVGSFVCTPVNKYYLNFSGSLDWPILIFCFQVRFTCRWVLITIRVAGRCLDRNGGERE